MKVLVDTCVWSFFLRRQNQTALNPEEYRLTGILREAIRDGRIAIIGPIRQEVLSGIGDKSQFRRTAEILEPFADEGLTTPDYVEAARCFNRCRDQGVECGPVDILICAVAAQREFMVLSNDRALVRCLDVLRIPHT